MEVVPICDAHRAVIIVHELLEYYNVSKEEYDEYDPRNVQVLEMEGEWAIEGLELESVAYTQPIKMRKVNIGMIENLKVCTDRGLLEQWDSSEYCRLVA
jgi:hypothetical protein